MGISPKYMQNVIRQYRTLFYRELSHVFIKIANVVKKNNLIKNQSLL